MIAKLNITVAVKGENPKITERQLLTHEQLLKLFKDAQKWINDQTNTYTKWTVKLGYNPQTKSFSLYSMTIGEGGIVELAEVEYRVSDPVPRDAFRTNKMMDALWDREFPLHVKMKKLQDQSQVCGEMLEWLQETKDIHFAQYHEHTDACYDEDECPPMYEGQKAPYCGCFTETLYPINIPLLDLLHEFFGVDRKEFNAEKERMLEEVRS